MNAPAAPRSDEARPSRRRWIKNWRDLLLFFVIFIAISLVIAIGLFVAWASNPAAPAATALSALAGSPGVTVTDADGLLTFTPDQPRALGVIFYPGGLVNTRAYAPILLPLAEAGYQVVAVDMPLNLAVFDLNAADRVRAAYPEITTWVLAGHSLGGAMASEYVLAHPEIVGLALLASNPAQSLAGVDQPVLYIYGDRDGLRPNEEFDGIRQTLPAATEYVLIAGGNHAQFGDYGAQNGDLPATIPAQEQWDQTVASMLTWLESVGG